MSAPFFGPPVELADDSALNADGIVRTVMCAVLVVILYWCTALLGEANFERPAAAPATPAALDIQQSTDWISVGLALIVVVAVAANYVRVQSSRPVNPGGAHNRLQGDARKPAQDAVRAHNSIGTSASQKAIYRPGGSRACFDAVEADDGERLARLLMRPEEHGIDWVNSIGRSALTQACVRKRPILASMLLDAGACCARGDASGRRALDWARMWSHAGCSAHEQSFMSKVLRELEVRDRCALARRRWRVSARAVDAVSALWVRVKETRYAPGGAGYVAAQLSFEEAARVGGL